MPSAETGLRPILQGSRKLSNAAPVLRFDTGPRMKHHLTLDPDNKAAHWFLLVIAVGRQMVRSLFEPPAADVFAAARRAWIYDALLESLIWHHENAAGSADGELNACRGSQFVWCGEWDSGGDGAAWVLE